MTAKIVVSCNRCGVEIENPPAVGMRPGNAGWIVLSVTADDGASLAGSLGHLCFECRQDLEAWLRKGPSRIQ